MLGIGKRCDHVGWMWVRKILQSRDDLDSGRTKLKRREVSQKKADRHLCVFCILAVSDSLSHSNHTYISSN